MDSINVKRVQRQPPPTQRKPTQHTRPLREEASRQLANRPSPPSTVPSALTQSLDHIRRQLYNALPIPPQVVPVVASVEEVMRYEGLFTKGWKGLTISEILHPYNGVVNGSATKAEIGKIVFLTRFFRKVKANELNRDFAIVCRNLEIENILDQHLSPLQFNTKLLSQHFRSEGFYGLIVKIRKNETIQNRRPIERNEVDAIFVFDAACEFEKYNGQTLLKGTYAPRLHIVYLCPMDSAEIRIHTYNRFINDPAREIRWDTKIAHLSDTIRDIVLLQPNRKVNHIFLIGWNDYLSQALLNWVYQGDKIEPYEHRFQRKGGLLKQVLEFPTHHPITEPEPERPMKVTGVIVNAPRPNNISAQSSQQTSVNGNSSSIAGPSRVPRTTTVRSTVAAPMAAAASGGVERLSLLATSNNTPDVDQDMGDTRNDYKRKYWQDAIGSNASTMAESLKRSLGDNERKNVQNKRLKENQPTSFEAIQAVNWPQMPAALDSHLAADLLASPSMFSAPNIAGLATGGTDLISNAFPAAQSSNDAFGYIHLSAVASEQLPVLPQQLPAFTQQIPTVAPQVPTVAQEGRSDNDVSLNHAMSSTTSTPATNMIINTLAQKYEDFIQNALNKFESDLRSLF